MREQDLQEATLRWVQLVNEEHFEKRGPQKLHAIIKSSHVARNYGVPEEYMRKYLQGEREKEESCRSLPFTLIMVVSYTAMAVGHDPVYPVNAVQEAIIMEAEENANFAFNQPNVGFKGFHDANSRTDIWSWTINGFAPLMFQQTRAFGEQPILNEPGFFLSDPHLAEAEKNSDLPLDTRGLILHFNRLIGGIRFRQERGPREECKTMKRLQNTYNRKCSENYGGSGYELYPELETAKKTLDPMKDFWLWAHDDVEINLEKLREKEREGWLDEETVKMEIVVPVYNGQFGVYSVIHFNFFFSYGGHIWKRAIPFSTYSKWFYSPWNVIPDVLWIIGLMFTFASETYKIADKVKGKTGGLHVLRTEYLSFWNITDWMNVIAGIWIITGFFARFSATQTLNQDLTNLGILRRSFLDTGQGESSMKQQAENIVNYLEEEVTQADIFRLYLGCYPLMIVMRLFKTFSHQPRFSGDAVLGPRGNMSGCTNSFQHMLEVVEQQLTRRMHINDVSITVETIPRYVTGAEFRGDPGNIGTASCPLFRSEGRL
jgi:hypothetical protein